jgi:dGTPase
MKYIENVSVSKIYNYKSVIEKEIAGYQIIAGLLEEFIPAMLGTGRSKHYNDKLIALIPIQFTATTKDPYARIMSVLDYISGMTDLYAVELYRKIKGIAFPEFS